MDNGWGDTVQLRIALWEGKGGGRSARNVQRFTSFGCRGAKIALSMVAGQRWQLQGCCRTDGRGAGLHSSPRRWVLDAVERN